MIPLEPHLNAQSPLRAALEPTTLATLVGMRTSSAHCGMIFSSLAALNRFHAHHGYHEPLTVTGTSGAGERTVATPPPGEREAGFGLSD